MSQFQRIIILIFCESKLKAKTQINKKMRDFFKVFQRFSCLRKFSLVVQWWVVIVISSAKFDHTTWRGWMPFRCRCFISGSVPRNIGIFHSMVCGETKWMTRRMTRDAVVSKNIWISVFFRFTSAYVFFFRQLSLSSE